MEHPVISPGAAIADAHHDRIVQTGGIGLRADFQHPAIVTSAVLPRGEGRRTNITALEDRTIGGIVVRRLQEHGWIKGTLNGQVTRHRISRFVHSTKITPGSRSCCPASAAPGDWDGAVQLCGAVVDVPIGIDLHGVGTFRYFSDGHTVAALPEEDRECCGTNIQHFLNRIKRIRQGELHLEGVIDIDRSAADNRCCSVRQCDRCGVGLRCTERILYLQRHAVLVADGSISACRLRGDVGAGI